jgi:hypothetical protein
MRKELASQAGERKKFRAIFSKIGKKTNFKGYSEDTILFKDVREVETNKLVADHLWFNFTRSFENITLTEGSNIEFEARVKVYAKGYVNKAMGHTKRSFDYKLSHPTKVKIVGSGL